MNKLTNLALVAGLGALSLTACGGSNSEGTTASFCDSLIRLDESGVDPDTDFDGAIKALEDVKSNAPGDLKGDLETFISIMNRVNDAGDDADFSEFEDDLDKLTASVDNIQTYADDNCEGLPEDLYN